MIIGDLNSRTGSRLEILEICSELDGANCSTETENISTRVSKDSVVNHYGRKLLDLCRHDNIIIVNGRTLGDLHGQYTNFTYNSCSVIDYCITNRNLYARFLYFEVSEPSHLSDHAQISVCLKGRVDTNLSETKVSNNLQLFP